MDWTSIIVSVITAAATIITVKIQTDKNKKETVKRIEETAHETQQLAEVNDYKTYLLLLLNAYPTKEDEIYTVARHYFNDLGGDSFIVPIFEDWIVKKKADMPEWFLKAKENHPRA